MESQIKYARGKNPNNRNGYKKGHRMNAGRVLSEEHKQTLSRIRSGVGNPMYGKRFSAKTLQKMSDSHKGFKHTEESKRVIGLKHEGDQTKSWKGDLVGYSGVHAWISKQYGKASCCENQECKQKSQTYQWANVSKEYKRERSDWVSLCVSCHQLWDRGLIVMVIKN